MKPSKSPERYTFQKNSYIERCAKEGKNPSPAYIQLYESEAAADEEWAKLPNHDNDMEWDLRTTDWILEKVRNSDVYAQNLYAAICNNEFQKIDVFPILANKTCSYSWRYAGGIIADMQMKGDYIDWYCSGIRADPLDDDSFQALDKEARDAYIMSKEFVAESVVTKEIEDDLKRLGWMVVTNRDEPI